MKVIFTSDLGSIGRQGEVKDVKNGLARNHLLPKKLAVKATPGNLKMWEQKSKSLQKIEDKIHAEAEALASKLNGISVRIPVKVGGGGRLFGSVTSQSISDSLKMRGFEISRKDIDLKDPIKNLGDYDIVIKLHPKVSPLIKVEVVSEEEEPKD